MPVVRDEGDGVWLSIRLAPRASRDKILGEHGGRLKIAVTSPPVDGEANAHVIRFLAKSLGVAKSAVEIVRGQYSREKDIHIAGVRAADVEKLWR
ncbi:MAG: DUF167 family protein [Deltaproteobacteria bacterium]|nr:DUF167 family protein [Deltaproteobacteria bacterium]